MHDLNRSMVPHCNHLPITSRCTRALGNTDVEGWRESPWPGSTWAWGLPPKRPLTKLETLSDAFSIPHLPRHRPCPANLGTQTGALGWGWQVTVIPSSQHPFAYANVKETWLDSPCGKWPQLTLQSGGSWSVFLCFPCPRGPGPADRGRIFSVSPGLGVWVGQSQVGIFWDDWD